MSKESFRAFVRKNPTLASHVNSGSMSWQKFYEMFDLYGDSSEVWNTYLQSSSSVKTNTVTKLNNIIKNVDVDSIKEHINTAQKALDFVQELTGKSTSNVTKSVMASRPINKFFED